MLDQPEFLSKNTNDKDVFSQYRQAKKDLGYGQSWFVGNEYCLAAYRGELMIPERNVTDAIKRAEVNWRKEEKMTPVASPIYVDRQSGDGGWLMYALQWANADRYNRSLYDGFGRLVRDLRGKNIDMNTVGSDVFQKMRDVDDPDSLKKSIFDESEVANKKKHELNQTPTMELLTGIDVSSHEFGVKRAVVEIVSRLGDARLVTPVADNLVPILVAEQKRAGLRDNLTVNSIPLPANYLENTQYEMRFNGCSDNTRVAVEQAIGRLKEKSIIKILNRSLVIEVDKVAGSGEASVNATGYSLPVVDSGMDVGKIIQERNDRAFYLSLLVDPVTSADKVESVIAELESLGLSREWSQNTRDQLLPIYRDRIGMHKGLILEKIASKEIQLKTGEDEQVFAEKFAGYVVSREIRMFCKENYSAYPLQRITLDTESLASSETQVDFNLAHEFGHIWLSRLTQESLGQLAHILGISETGIVTLNDITKLQTIIGISGLRSADGVISGQQSTDSLDIRGGSSDGHYLKELLSDMFADEVLGRTPDDRSFELVKDDPVFDALQKFVSSKVGETIKWFEMYESLRSKAEMSVSIQDFLDIVAVKNHADDGPKLTGDVSNLQVIIDELKKDNRDLQKKVNVTDETSIQVNVPDDSSKNKIKTVELNSVQRQLAELNMELGQVQTSIASSRVELEHIGADLSERKRQVVEADSLLERLKQDIEKARFELKNIDKPVVEPILEAVMVEPQSKIGELIKGNDTAEAIISKMVEGGGQFTLNDLMKNIDQIEPGWLQKVEERNEQYKNESKKIMQTVEDLKQGRYDGSDYAALKKRAEESLPERKRKNNLLAVNYWLTNRKKK